MRPQLALERTISACWDSFAGVNGTAGLTQLSDSPLLHAEFNALTQAIRASGISENQVLHRGHKILDKLYLAARALDQDNSNLDLTTACSGITPKQWSRCLSKILERLERETSYFHDSVTSAALNIARSGKLSGQLKSIIIPITVPPLRALIKQPIFFANIGVILHPGAMPSAREIVTSLASSGRLPASFMRLQETVAEILTWPIAKRISSLIFSSIVSLATLPLQLAAKAILFVPRILGVRWLKFTKLPIFVDDTLAQTFAAISTVTNSISNPLQPQTSEAIECEVLKSTSASELTKVRAAVKSLMSLRALGVSQLEIGKLVNGARYNAHTQSFSKLDRAIHERGAALGIDSSSELERLLQLDDAIGRLAFAETRIKSIAIARDEISRLIQENDSYQPSAATNSKGALNLS